MKMLKRLSVILMICMLLQCLSDRLVTVSAAEQATSYVSAEEAVLQLREQMVQRNGKIVLNVQTKDFDADAFWYDLISKATAHTGNPTEGDYIRFHLKEIAVSMEYYVSENIYYVTATFDVDYFTSAKQEKELNTDTLRFCKVLILTQKQITKRSR